MITHSNRTIPGAVSVDGPKTKNLPNFWLDVILAILLFVIILSIISGCVVFHCIAGAVLFTCGIIHLALHDRWIKAVVLGTPRNLTPAIRSNRRLFFGLLVSFLVCGLSGIATLVFSHGLPHLFLPMLCFWVGFTI